ncbi:MAG: hypothetical protein IKC22_03815 [Bacilli bacterium]|nr:hypothetical protein [Bacilli bacterium]
MKNRFDRQFKNAFNETYNYSNENIEANFNKETKTKWYNHRLRYSLCLIMLTMLITISLSALVFGLWYDENKNINQSQEILEYVRAENRSKYVELFYAYQETDFDIYLFKIQEGIDKYKIALYFINNDIKFIDDYVITVKTGNYEHEFCMNEQKSIKYLSTCIVGDLISCQITFKNIIKLNLSQNLK